MQTPRKRELTLEALEKVLGRDSTCYRDLVRAIDSNDELDLMLASSSIDQLPVNTRQQLLHALHDLEELTAGRGPDASGNGHKVA